MSIKCVECNYTCRSLLKLRFHYKIEHKDKIIECECGYILSGIFISGPISKTRGITSKCSNSNFSSNSISNSNSDSNFNSDSNSISSFNPTSSSSPTSNPNVNVNANPKLNVNPNPNVNVNPNPNVNVNVNPNPNQKVNVNPNPKVIANPNPNVNVNVKPNPKVNVNPNPNVNVNARNNNLLTRKCNRCNSLKPLTDFDESKYTCRSYTSAKVNCLFCPSVVRYDRIRAHIKKQHPDVDLTRGFTKNLTERSVNTQNGENCSCKYYNLATFLINNGIDVDKLKENINLLKGTDHLKIKK